MNDDEFRAFYEQHYRRLWAYIMRLTGDRAATDDVVQEAFMRILAIDHEDTMTSDHRKNYLYKIAVNLSNRRHREVRREEELADVIPSSTEPTEEAIGVRQALDSMKPVDRSLLWLVFVEGFSHREAAAILGYKEPSIRPLVHRAKRKLLDFLQKRRPSQ